MSLEKLKKNPEVDIVLNSGDRIYIPSEKSTITVTGEVLAPTRLRLFKEPSGE